MKPRVSALAILLSALPGLGITRAWAQGTPTLTHASDDRRVGRPFVIEVYGGFSSVAGGDVRRLGEYDEQVQQLLYDRQLDALVANGSIRSWTKDKHGKRPGVGSAWSAGARVKQYVTGSLALSLGYQYVSAGGSGNPRWEYTRDEGTGYRSTEELSYSPYTLSITASAPVLGIHVSRHLKKHLEAEVSVRGGPLFAKFEHVSSWSYRWTMQGPDVNGLIYAYDGRIDGRGKGTGVLLDAGLRMQYAIGKRLAAFVEGSYGYQKVKDPSGPGSEVNGDVRSSWDGKWAVKLDRIVAPWGSLEAELPTSDWQDESSNQKLHGFDLDLSGIQVRIGISFIL